MDTNNLKNELELAGVAALAAASKSPFKTAFLITIGIGLGRLILVLGFIAGVILIYKFI